MAVSRKRTSRLSWQTIFREWAQKLDDCAKASCISVKDDSLLPVALAKIAAIYSDELLLVVTAGNDQAENLADNFENFRVFLGDSRSVIPVPEVAMNRQQWMPENESSCCAALDSAVNGIGGIYLAGVRVLLGKTLSPKYFQRECIDLKIGDEFPPEKLVSRLIKMDYDNEAEVTAPGEFSWRGGIIDVYPPLYDHPIRIEFFGNEIDGMRVFSPEDQKSFEKTERIRIIPRGSAVIAQECYKKEDIASVIDFFVPKMRMIICNPESIRRQIEEFGSDEDLQCWQNAVNNNGNSIFIYSHVDEVAAAPENTVELPVSSMSGLFTDDIADAGNGIALWHWQMLRNNLLRWQSEKYHLVACCAGSGEVERLKEILDGDAATQKMPIEICQSELSCGILIPDAKLALLGDGEIFGRRNVRRLIRQVDYKYQRNVQDAMELEDGVLAVHLNYGICIYHGLKTTSIDGELVETIELEFAEDARIYVPLDEAHLVSRYVGGSKIRPELSNPGSAAWNHSKEKAANAAWGLAAELLRLEALRQGSEGIQFKPCVEWERSFAGSFPFEATRDQQEAIDSCLRDMASERPMDRLLCGDVGYGKTEVAMRAAFRAVMNGYQVALLVPTTVLAQQHYQNFIQRMAEYPVRVEMLSRFRSHASQKKVLDQLAAGEIDIIIGTHRIIQKDVKFASLGLLIIDEEQRFGVKHKQQLKAMRSCVDILTMTATPIPRTLYMSLSGIRNLSTIMTAPNNRLPVQTIVAYFDQELVKQAINRELERKGQVFFLYNRVGEIEKIAKMLQDLVPQARFGIGHGQMSPLELEKVMTDFVAGKFDVLVSTTIIESGIDIPNANTIIIDRADRFGLSELYQLRGRVGRDFRQGYAYLLLPPMGALPENARQRIAAIKRYTHLGAGFKLAMKDLEIRGAGNILGEEQSGHIAAVGFDLYCSLLQDAVAKLEKREMAERSLQVPVLLDFVTSSLEEVDGRVQAVLPPEYIEDPVIRIDCYKRLEKLVNERDVQNFGGELTDRFGKLPSAVENLLLLQSIKILAREKKLIRVAVKQNRVILESNHGLIKSNGRVPELKTKSGRGALKELFDILNNL